MMKMLQLKYIEINFTCRALYTNKSLKPSNLNNIQNGMRPSLVTKVRNELYQTLIEEKDLLSSIKHTNTMSGMKVFLTVLLALICSTSAFVSKSAGQKSGLKLALVPGPEAPVVLQEISQSPLITTQNVAMNEHIAKWNDNSVTVSLQERKPPTKEEIEAKKRNFNLWFWGGGFVAPMLATFYYFGLQFWKY